MLRGGHREAYDALDINPNPKSVVLCMMTRRWGAMRTKAFYGFVVLVGLLILSLPLAAHHGNASYDNKVLTLKGTVTEWRWINPHVFLKIDVKGDDGKVVNWTCELVAPSNMINFGFTGDSFKPGDQVTVVTTQIARSGAPIARLGYNPAKGLLRGWQDPK
jgi:hypothetical protein